MVGERGSAGCCCAHHRPNPPRPPQEGEGEGDAPEGVPPLSCTALIRAVTCLLEIQVPPSPFPPSVPPLLFHC